MTARNDHAVRVSLFGGPIPTGTDGGLFTTGSLVEQLAASTDYGLAGEAGADGGSGVFFCSSRKGAVEK